MPVTQVRGKGIRHESGGEQADLQRFTSLCRLSDGHSGARHAALLLLGDRFRRQLVSRRRRRRHRCCHRVHPRLVPPLRVGPGVRRRHRRHRGHLGLDDGRRRRRRRRRRGNRRALLEGRDQQLDRLVAVVEQLNAGRTVVAAERVIAPLALQHHGVHAKEKM